MERRSDKNRLYRAPPDVYLPPRGVEVRPLEEHPAFTLLEQPELAKERRSYTWRSGKPKQSANVDRIVDVLRSRGGATVGDLTKALNLSDGHIRGILLGHPELFQQMGQRPSTSTSIHNRWKGVVVWGLTRR